jgi:hypothetical protein
MFSYYREEHTDKYLKAPLLNLSKLHYTFDFGFQGNYRESYYTFKFGLTLTNLKLEKI